MMTLIKALIKSLMGAPLVITSTTNCLVNLAQAGEELSLCAKDAAENFRASLIREAAEEAAKATASSTTQP